MSFYNDGRGVKGEEVTSVVVLSTVGRRAPFPIIESYIQIKTKMIEVIGLIFLGLWAAGKAKQKGRNQYLWSLVPVAFYLIIYVLTYWALGLSVGPGLSSTGSFSLAIVMFIRIGLIPICFIVSKFLLDAVFKRMADGSLKDKTE